ncbi:YihY/virulence factor BrkB family protein [Tomitella gaofuii]|uniref:YihY/virulence factor BrkB family protein n=1 Tax=Tomitella gaofuii TaxID=2760083 RepID=UPI0015F911FC|nr:YihY/virulence factor BrkB family protein [Tomitella gaofuii]
MDEHGQADGAPARAAGWARGVCRGVLGALATVWRVIARVSVKSFTEGIFGRSAQAAFWQTLSLPPLLLGLLGSLGYIGGLFGPDTVDLIESKIVTAAHTVFTDNVVDQIIQPTIVDILARGRGAIVSVGFVLSLWAGSSAISCFVDAIVEAHGQKEERHPVWQRVVALFLYLFFLLLSVITLPLVALGPTYIAQIMPDSWYGFGSRLIDIAYFPAVGVLLVAGLTTLYKLALPRSLPWHRLLGGAVLAGVFFVLASAGLRFYLTLVTQTGYSYGALATPIAFLLFTFFLGFAVVLGAQFNAVIQEFWPARRTRIDQLRDWLSTQSDTLDGLSGAAATSPLRRIASAPRRTTVQRHPAARPEELARPPVPDHPSPGGPRAGTAPGGEVRQLPDGRVS